MTTSMQHLTRPVLFVLLTLMLGAAVSGCMQSHRASAAGLTANAGDPISDHTLAMVNRSFKKAFMFGDWRYKGAQAVNGGINAYFQIPQKLDMAEEYQENYLRQAICPSAEEKQLWEEMRGRSLSVHIYTINKRFSVHAECLNPLV